MPQTLVYDLLVILAAGLFAGLVCRWLRVSVLIGYLVVGALLGEGFLGLVRDESHELEHFAEVGVFLLLFTIGLEFSIDDLRRLGYKVVVAGGSQMALVALPVAALLSWRGNPWQSACLIASAISFSSTVLVFKALSEWGQAEKSHGVRAIGILLFQDAALIPLLLLVPLLTGSGDLPGVNDYLILVLVSVVFVFAVIGLRWSLGNWIVPKFAGYRSPELVILFTIVSLGGVTLAAYTFGLPPAVGAFAAGIIFNGNRWTKQIDALLLPFRETFAAIFFVGLGLIFDPRLLWQEPLWIFAALVFVVLLKGTASTVALRLTGLPLRSSIGMGIGLAHVGEFAFVLVLLGLESGALQEEDYQRVVAVAVGSLILTPPLMQLGLRLVNAKDDVETEKMRDASSLNPERAIVIGAGPIGRQVASQLEIMGKQVCLVDFSPINLHSFAQEGFETIAGDATQPSILELAGSREAELFAVCVPQDDSALQIVKAIRSLIQNKANSEAQIIVRCRYQANVPKLKSKGAHFVVSEEAEASTALLQVLRKFSQ